jgi:hypothetical protein
LTKKLEWKRQLDSDIYIEMKQDYFKAYKDNLSRIREEYPILYEYSDLWAMGVYRQINEGLLTEFLKTVDPDVTMRQVQAKLGKVDHRIITAQGQTKFIQILFTPQDRNGRLDEAIKILDKFGWYPGTMYLYGTFQVLYKSEELDNVLKQGRATIVVFEPKYDAVVSSSRYLYHITSDLYADSVDLKGLVPKSHSKSANHPKRIYLLGNVKGGTEGLSRNNIKKLAVLLHITTKKAAKDRTNVVVVYKIDTKKVKNLELREDPQFASYGDVKAYYTHSNIPPDAIEQEFSFSPSELAKP